MRRPTPPRGLRAFPDFTGALAAPDADADGDGWNGFAEFAFDLDPLAFEPGAAPLVAEADLPDPNAGGALRRFATITFTRRTDAPQLTYTPQRSGELDTGSKISFSSSARERRRDRARDLPHPSAADHRTALPPGAGHRSISDSFRNRIVTISGWRSRAPRRKTRGVMRIHNESVTPELARFCRGASGDSLLSPSHSSPRRSPSNRAQATRSRVPRSSEVHRAR